MWVYLFCVLTRKLWKWFRSTVSWAPTRLVLPFSAQVLSQIETWSKQIWQIIVPCSIKNVPNALQLSDLWQRLAGVEQGLNGGQVKMAQCPILFVSNPSTESNRERFYYPKATLAIIMQTTHGKTAKTLYIWITSTASPSHQWYFPTHLRAMWRNIIWKRNFKSHYGNVTGGEVIAGAHCFVC